MPTRPSSPDPTGAQPDADRLNPFAGFGAGMGFLQDWMKAAGSALPHLPGSAGGTGGAPSWSMPTLDPEELDKRIQDLKTVQFWLEQNARMIAMTIQGLEVQRMTLSTLKGMNVSMDALRDSLKARTTAAEAPPPAPEPAASPFSTFPKPSWMQRPTPVEPPAPPAPPPPPPEPPAPPPQAPAAEPHATAEAAELINPMRWWDTLTQQFTHLATQAAGTVPTVGQGASAAPRAAAKSPRKPAAKSPTKASTKPPTKAASKPAPRRRSQHSDDADR